MSDILCVAKSDIVLRTAIFIPFGMSDIFAFGKCFGSLSAFPLRSIGDGCPSPKNKFWRKYNEIRCFYYTFKQPLT